MQDNKGGKGGKGFGKGGGKVGGKGGGKGGGKDGGKGKGKGGGGKKGGGQQRNDQHERGEHFGNAAGARRGGKGGRGNFDEGSPWVPPTTPLNCQQRRVELSPNHSYNLFFPFELTNKDYMRRVLEIVAHGIQHRVVQIVDDKGLEPIPPENQHDTYYLLKAIKQPGNAERFVESLPGCEKGKLFHAAIHVLDTRNGLFHLQPDTSRLADLHKLFEATRQLLECFGASAAMALQQLHQLEQQQLLHKESKEKRMHAHGWAWEGVDGAEAEEQVQEQEAGGGATLVHGRWVVGGGCVDLRWQQRQLTLTFNSVLSERDRQHTRMVQLLLGAVSSLDARMKREGEAGG
jgi:hypothetical protein